MAGVPPPRGPQLLQTWVKGEDGGTGPGPKEEASDQPAPDAAAVAFSLFPPPAAILASGSKRKKEKNAEGSALLPVDRRKSKVWNYYAKMGDAYVECNVCKKQLSFHNSTTTMREHLVRKHGIRDALFSHPGVEFEPENTPKRWRESGSCHGGGAAAEARCDVIAELAVEMAFHDVRPLPSLRDKGFGMLLAYLEPSFTLPAPAQLAAILGRRYEAVKRHVERYLQEADGAAVAVTAEFWLSRLGQPYVSVTAHFIDGEWRRARCALATRPTREAGAEGELREKLPSILAEFGLRGAAIFCVVHDGGGTASATAAAAGGSGGWIRSGCAARNLHLSVQAGLEVEPVREALSVARELVGYFQRDAEAARSLKAKLETIGNKSQRKLVGDVASRWMSTVDMCEALLELKWAIMAVLEENPAIPSLADHQWKLLQDLVGLTRTMKIAAAFLREEQNASVSALLPCVHGVVAAVARQAEEHGGVMAEVAGAIRAELTRRWGLAEEEEALESPAVMAAFLDPRFKELRFLSPGSRSELHRRVKAMLSGGFTPQIPPPTPFHHPHADHKAEGDAVGAWPKERSSAAASQSIYDVLLGQDPTENMPELHQQLDNYVVEPLCKRSVDPLRWWKNNRHRFPAVARLSRKYLAVPATAAPAARALAVGESDLERRRAALGPEDVEQILFLHHNGHFLEGPGSAAANEAGSGKSC